MTTIYCSKKLNDFLGKEMLSASNNSVGNELGGWNGHLFNYQRKKYLILINTKTYYALLFPPIKKADLRNFENLFLQKLLHQLVYDQIISVSETLVLLQKLLPVSFSKTNNDKKAIGTLNDFIYRFKVELDYFGWSDQDIHNINNKLNDTLVGASRPKQGDYGCPMEDMKQLINTKT